MKNITGTLLFDQTFHQLIRKQNGREEAFADPILQVQRQELELKDWLTQHQANYLPIFSFVIISNPSTMIETTSNERRLHEKVIHRNYLPHKLQQIEQTYKSECLSEKQIKKLIRTINKQHVPLDTPILEQFQLTKMDLLRGVHCPNCSQLPLTRIYAHWHCPNCSFKGKEAHIQALKDYRLLIDKHITNQEAKEFLQLTCSSLTKRLLQHKDIVSTGEKKRRVYRLAFD